MFQPPQKTLNIKSCLKTNGFEITVERKKFSIVYPQEIWKNTPLFIRQVLMENITFGETHYLPLILNKTKVKYDFSFPLWESSLFKNQLFDLLDCERMDKAEHLSYLRQFYNLEFEFQSPDSTLPDFSQIPRYHTSGSVAIIPFSFGKESLTTFALCRELGIMPILIYFQEPVQPYEERYKLKKLAELREEYKVKTYFVRHEPGLFRYGRAFRKKQGTEIGWGNQTTLFSLLAIPFVFAYRARYLLFGNEYSNNEIELVKDWKVYHSVDQHNQMTALQNNLVRLLTDKQCSVKTSLEPLEEINIFYILHHRYPQIGRYQFSCCAEKPLYQDSQWCHSCYKCCRMFLFSRCLDINPFHLGFKKDLLKKAGMFNYYFGTEIKTGSEEDLDFAFYWLYKKGLKSPYLTKFKRTKLPKLKPWSWYLNHFIKLHPSFNLPPSYKKKLISLFRQEMSEFRKLLPH